MKNGGIIGVLNTPTTSVASGVWELGTIYAAKIEDIWPEALTLYYYNKYNANESYSNPDSSWTGPGAGYSFSKDGYSSVSFSSGSTGWYSSGVYTDLPEDPANANGHYYTYQGYGGYALWWDNYSDTVYWDVDQYVKYCDITYSQGTYITQIQEYDGVYPDNGYQSGYWWVKGAAV